MIKGIDSQIMVTRAADFVRDTSQLQRQHEIGQNFQAMHTQALAELEKSRVAQTEKIEEAYIKDEEKESSGDSYEQQEDQYDGETAEQSHDQPFKPTSLGSHTIDIKI